MNRAKFALLMLINLHVLDYYPCVGHSFQVLSLRISTHTLNKEGRFPTLVFFNNNKSQNISTHFNFTE